MTTPHKRTSAAGKNANDTIPARPATSVDQRSQAGTSVRPPTTNAINAKPSRIAAGPKTTLKPSSDAR
jgi:hypothetical protein